MRFHRNAAALPDMLACTLAIALLATLIIGSLESEWRERQQTGRCVGNLFQIGRALQQYSAEDRREQTIPLHYRMLSSAMGINEWLYVLPWTWGGVSGTVPWPFVGSRPVLTESHPLGQLWAGNTRPLRRYVPQGPISAHGYDVGIFECPADVGYPQDDPANGVIIEDMPGMARNIPLIDGVGNSYRLPTAGTLLTQGRWFTATAVGQPLSALVALDRQIVAADPLFFEVTRPFLEPPPPIMGWHGAVAADNVLYADGSVRFTYAETNTLVTFPGEPPFSAPPGVNFDALFRATQYKQDCYPAPGAAFSPTPNISWVTGLGGNQSAWPYVDPQVHTPQ